MTREPMKRYLRGAVGLVSKLVRRLDVDFDPESMTASDQDALLEHAFERYFDGGWLLGSVETCRAAENCADSRRSRLKES